MNWRDDLELFGIHVPERIPLDDWAASLKDKPCENTLILVGVATVLFYCAEKGRNPKVNDIWDALVYCSTNLSVGYADIFAKTPLGKILGSTLMIFGPSLAAGLLDGRPGNDSPSDPVHAEILTTLREILHHLERADTDSRLQ